MIVPGVQHDDNVVGGRAEEAEVRYGYEDVGGGRAERRAQAHPIEADAKKCKVGNLSRQVPTQQLIAAILRTGWCSLLYTERKTGAILMHCPDQGA